MPKWFTTSRAPRGFCAALTCTALTLLAAQAAFAQQTTVKLDPAKTQVSFTLGATMHTVHGTFKLKSGEITVDPASGKASGTIVVDAASGDSDNSSRDQKMHKDILESAKYTDIVFSPTQITAAPGHTVGQSLQTKGNNQLQAAGTFRLHGADHPFTMPLAVESDGAGHVVVTSSFSVPFIDWGLKSPNTFILRVSNSVDVEIHSTGEIVAAAH